MQNYAHDLFLLSTNLSQLKSKDLIIKLFIESINSTFPSNDFIWSPQIDEQEKHVFIVCTRFKTYGIVRYGEHFKFNNEAYVLLQNATQLLAIILEKLEQESLLNDQKNHLNYLVEEKTLYLIQSQAELEERNEEIENQNHEYWQINEKLSIANKELQLAKEKAEESDRLKTAFLQNMSHEIRTPMNAIMGFSQLLIKQFNNKHKLKEFSEIIRRRCNDLLTIINDILDIAKIESGQLSVNLEDCDLNELFTELNFFFVNQQKQLGKQQISFSLKTHFGDEDCVILTDKVKLKQIFINLISNAFKFTNIGSIEGGCRVDNNQVLFYVSDTGIGIPADKFQTIFERFIQLRPAENKLVTGTGLGLPIVKGLLTLMGGNIWFESTLGKGTTFYFTLPYNKAIPIPHAATYANKPRKCHFPGKTVLIVEDDIYNTEYLKEILLTTEMNILYSEYGQDAIQQSVSNTIDLVLMDILLPDMNGYEATRHIKQLKPEVIIIAQTAYASPEEKQKALDAGCNDYISKPIKEDLLFEIIENQLSK